MQQRAGSRGFTLIELMIVVAIIAILAAIAVPALLRARLAANETATIGTLRTLCTSQMQFKSACIVDQDGDGAGEFGWLQELGATTPYRVMGGGLSAVGVNPPYITSVLGETARNNGGVADKSGFAYLVYLPTDVGLAAPEGPGPPTFPGTVASVQSNRFVIYSWPTALRNSGIRAFAVNQQGEQFATANVGAQDYTGRSLVGVIPPPEAAFVDSGGDDIDNLEGFFSATQLGGDGFPWVPAGN